MVPVSANPLPAGPIWAGCCNSARCGVRSTSSADRSRPTEFLRRRARSVQSDSSRVAANGTGRASRARLHIGSSTKVTTLQKPVSGVLRGQLEAGLSAMTRLRDVSFAWREMCDVARGQGSSESASWACVSSESSLPLGTVRRQWSTLSNARPRRGCSCSVCARKWEWGAAAGPKRRALLDAAGAAGLVALALAAPDG